MQKAHINRTKSVTVLSLIYLVNVLCTGGSLVIISYVYDTIGLFNIGQSIMFIIWFSYSFGIFYTKQILGMFTELKTCIFAGWIVSGFPILVGILAVGCSQGHSTEGFCSKTTIKILNWLSAFLIGAFACTFLWTGQYEFINRISQDEEKKAHFSVLYSYLQFAGIFSNLLNIFFYTYQVSTLWCFVIFYSLYVCATIAIPFLLPGINGYNPNLDQKGTKPNDFELVENPQQANASHVHQEDGLDQSHDAMNKEKNTNDKGVQNPNNSHENTEILKTPEVTPTIKEAIENYINLLMSPTMFKLFPFMIQSGMIQMWPASALYRFVVEVYAGSSATEFYVKKMICVNAIVIALGGYAASQVFKTVSGQRRDQAIIAMSWVVTGTTIFLYVASFWLNSVILVLIPSFLFGASDVGFNQLVSIYTADELPGKTEPFALFKLIQNLFCAANVLIFMAISQNTFTLFNAALFFGLALWLKVMMGTTKYDTAQDSSKSEKLVAS